MGEEQRVRELRKALGMTMDKFGAVLGVGKAAISKIEAGDRHLTDQMLKSICNTDWNGRRVSERWLRDGEGDMFLLQEAEDELISFVRRIASDPDAAFRRQVVTALARFSDDQWESLQKMLRSMTGEE